MCWLEVPQPLVIAPLKLLCIPFFFSTAWKQKGTVPIELLWSFLLTSRNLQSEFARSIQFFQLNVKHAFVSCTIAPKCLWVEIWFSPILKNLLKKRFFTPLYPTSRYCRWQLTPYTAPPHNIINFFFCLHCIYFTVWGMPNHTRSKNLLLATNLSSSVAKHRLYLECQCT